MLWARVCIVGFEQVNPSLVRIISRNISFKQKYIGCMPTKIFISTNIFEVVLPEAEPSCKKFFKILKSQSFPKLPMNTCLYHSNTNKNTIRKVNEKLDLNSDSFNTLCISPHLFETLLSNTNLEIAKNSQNFFFCQASIFCFCICLYLSLFLKFY